MKLYTEFEVKFAMDIARCQPNLTFDEVLEQITPIELPSGEEIEEPALKWFMTANKHEIIFDLGWMKIFEAGAKWMREQIQGGDK